MKKIISAFAICFMTLLLLSAFAASANIVQAQPPPQNKNSLVKQMMNSQIVAAAHWTETVPQQGGWIFASLVRDHSNHNKAWLYISGFHPAGVAGPFNTTFSGVKPVTLNVIDNKLVVKTTINFNVASGNGETSTAQHTVNINWSIPQDSLPPPGSVGPINLNMSQNELLAVWLKGVWIGAIAAISIDVDESSPHSDFATSDWATIGVLSPQKALTVAHWIVDSPVAGGWVFAAAGKNDLNNKAWLFVAGFHPTGALGINMPTTFQGLNTDVRMRLNSSCMFVPTASINFTVYSFELGPTINYELHDVSLDSDKLCARLGSDWRVADTDIVINTGGANQHSAFSCASFAMIDIDQPRHK